MFLSFASFRRASVALASGLVIALFSLAAAAADSKLLAPGFVTLPSGASIALMPPDVELFELGASGVLEPKAEWTEAAHKNLRSAVDTIEQGWNLNGIELSDADAEPFAEVSALHAAVAQSIVMHHLGFGGNALPTKGGMLDWSFGDAVAPLREKTNADYALFIWIRDSYTSGGRVAARIALALVGVHLLQNGIQQGYASLVDLRTGQVMWFNRLFRQTGDLRTAGPALDSLKALLSGFPYPR